MFSSVLTFVFQLFCNGSLDPFSPLFYLEKVEVEIKWMDECFDDNPAPSDHEQRNEYLDAMNYTRNFLVASVSSCLILKTKYLILVSPFKKMKI